MAIQLDAKTFCRRLKLLYKSWNVSIPPARRRANSSVHPRALLLNELKIPGMMETSLVIIRIHRWSQRYHGVLF